MSRSTTSSWHDDAAAGAVHPITSLNAVEGFFAKLTKQRLERGVFKGIVDLQAAINRYLAETNDNPKPFTWTADPDAIIEKVRRGKQALEVRSTSAPKLSICSSKSEIAVVLDAERRCVIYSLQMSDPNNRDAIEELGDRRDIPDDARDISFARAAGRNSVAEAKGRFVVGRSDNVVETWPRDIPRVQRKLSKLSRQRQRRWLSANRILFLMIVAIPTVTATIYFGLFASNRYVSTAELTVAEFNGSSVQGSQSNISTQNNNSAGLSAEQIVVLNAVSDYMTSHNIVNDLQKRLDLRALWSTPLADWFYRLRGDANNEDIYEYYQYRVSSSFDSSTGLITLAVEAFRPQRLSEDCKGHHGIDGN